MGWRSIDALGIAFIIDDAARRDWSIFQALYPCLKAKFVQKKMVTRRLRVTLETKMTCLHFEVQITFGVDEIRQTRCCLLEMFHALVKIVTALLQGHVSLQLGKVDKH